MPVYRLLHRWRDPRRQLLRSLCQELRMLIRHYCNFQTEYLKRHPGQPRLNMDLIGDGSAKEEFQGIRTRLREVDERITELKCELKR